MLCVGVVVDYFGGLGITLGAHRLWSHRSFKAKWPLRLLAALAQTVAGQVNCNIQYHSFGFYQLRGIYIRFQSTNGPETIEFITNSVRRTPILTTLNGVSSSPTWAG